MLDEKGNEERKIGNKSEIKGKVGGKIGGKNKRAGN